MVHRIQDFVSDAFRQTESFVHTMELHHWIIVGVGLVILGFICMRGLSGQLNP